MTAPADILSVAKSFVPRSQTWLYHEVAHLRRHRVHVAAQELFKLREYPHEPVTRLASGRSLGALAERLTYRLLLRPPPVLCPQARRRLADLLAGGSFRLVQAHFGWVGREVAAEVDRRGLPFAVWLYGADVFHRGEARRLARSFSNRHYYCCTSHALRRALEELGCPAGRIRVFYPGVEVPERPPERRTGEAVRVISVGRLVGFKAPLSLVAVARALRDRGCRLEWQHLGNGPLRRRMERAIVAQGLADCFRIRGEVPHAEVLAAMAAADLMIHAARVQPDGRRESFGVVLAEAAALGLPIVSARVGGIPEVVRDGETGLLVEEDDWEGLTDMAGQLIADPERRAALGRAAHRYARETFELSAQVEKLDAFYDEVLA